MKQPVLLINTDQYSSSQHKDELHHALHLSRPRIVVASALTLPSILATIDRCPFVQQLISLDAPLSATQKHRLIVTLSEFNRTAAKSLPNIISEFRCAAVIDMRRNVSLILCSSGTTGLPKGVQLTQYNLHAAVSNICAGIELMNSLGLSDGGALSVIPWFHAYGLMTCLGMAIGGVHIVTMARYSDRAFLQAIERQRCAVVFAVPPLLVMLAKQPAVDEYDLSSLLMIYSGAAPLSKETVDAVQRRLPNLMGVFQGFGMSEMTLSVLQQSLMYRTEGSVGVLRPGMWGKIIDPETGRTLRAGEHGEMCFRGSAIMRGYVGDERATRGTIDADGWLHTGDVGYYDEQGEWYIVDRLKELIKYKGFQVPPAELESLLLQHPDVVDAGVIGLPDESCGEKALGFVVRRNGAAALTEQQVLDFVSARVSYAKRLHGGVRFVAEIPKNPTGKILRRQLRDLVAHGKSKL